MNVSYLVLLEFFKRKEMPIYFTEKKIRPMSVFLYFQPPQLIIKSMGPFLSPFAELMEYTQ